ncbi:uncharacterized protein DEA37_0003168 [Paragonimus westermani]|uniref:Mucolipin extracytosolic domain-containing protein n=1 Tax=Paragonimus westermani TaxID=34504 RepID=A0A5J4NKF2_9TREM|nr:uncharacterized protein DEA37_0003168 [Paragonimus westermani]
MPARKRTARSPHPNSSESYHLPHPQCSHQVTDFSEEVIIPTIIPSNSAPISVSPAVFRSRPVLPPVYNDSSTALDIDDNKTERLPTFSCSRLNSQFESGMIRLSNCCAATCNRVCCRLPCVYSTHANSPNDSCSPLLSVPPADRGSSVDVCGGNDTLETTVEQSELDRLNTEVVEWVRRRLVYFFMSPIEKFHAKRRIPYKLVVQFLKVFFITLQLIVFGMERSAHVSFGEDSRLTFSHLYLRDWDPQYETLDYPPAAGPYAVYEKSDFYQNVGYVITQFNNTREIAIGAYAFNSRRPHMTLCQTDVDNAVNGLGSTEPQTKIRHCTKVYPMEIPAELLSDPEGVERFLVSLNFTIDFSRLCGWVVLGPYNLKFRTFVSTLECLFSLINGDDMFVTFSVIGERSAWGIFLFSRLFLYVFITLFIYVVLNLFITIIFEAYEEVKERRDTGGRSNHSLLFRFIANHPYSCRSPLFRQDDRRPDRHRLLQYALGRWTPTVTSNTSVDRSQFPASAGDDFEVTGSTLYRRCDLMRPEYHSSQTLRDSVPANPPVCNTPIAPTGSSSVSFISQTSGSGSSPNHVEHRPLPYAEEVEESGTLICSPVR